MLSQTVKDLKSDCKTESIQTSLGGEKRIVPHFTKCELSKCWFHLVFDFVKFNLFLTHL